MVYVNNARSVRFYYTYFSIVFLKHFLFNRLRCSGPENGEGSTLIFNRSSLGEFLEAYITVKYMDGKGQFLKDETR